jgi:hypothetical protein
MTSPRPLLALAAGLIVIVAAPAAAHAESRWPASPEVAERPPDLPPWLLASRLGRPVEDDASAAAALSDMSALLLRETPVAPIVADPLTVRSTGEADVGDLRVLLGKGERWHLLRVGAIAASRPQEARVSAYGAMPYLPTGPRPEGAPGYGPVVVPGADFDLALEELEEPVSLGLRGGIQGLEGGVDYRSVGKRLERLVSGPASQRDREGTEVWVAQSLGLLRLRLSQSDLADNVDRDPALPRTRRTQGAVSGQIATPSWPILGLTYARGGSERVWWTGDGATRARDEQTSDTVTAGLYYGVTRWDLSMSSTYVTSRDVDRPDHAMIMRYHDLCLTLRPTDALMVVPAVGTGLERSEWSETQSEAGSASLLLSYAPVARGWALWALGAYAARRSSDRTVDGQTWGWSGGLSWNLGRGLGGPATLSLQAGYDRYDDAVVRDSSVRSVFGLVRLRIAAF